MLRNRLRAGISIRLRKPKKWLPPDPVERQYARELLSLVDTIQEFTRTTIFPALPQLVEDASMIHGRRADSWSDNLGRLTTALRIKIDVDGPDERITASRAAGDTSEWNSRQWREIVREAIGVDVFASEPWLRDDLGSWARENANLISTLEDDAVSQVERWTQTGIRNGWRHEDIAKLIESRFDVSRARAKFIARDQIAKLNGDLTKERQTQSGVKKYTWRTSQDERVRGNPGGLYPDARPSHWAREGEAFLWTKAPAGGHPGKDYNCRCTAEPDLSGILEGLK